MAGLIGYRDWQRTATRTGEALVYVANSAASSYGSPVFAVGNTETLLLIAQPQGASYYSGTVEFFQHADGTFPTVTTPFVFGAGIGNLVAPISAVGPYCKITVSAGSGSPSDSYLLGLIPTTNTIRPANLSSVILANSGAGSVGANSTATTDAAAVVSGPASFNYWTSSPNWSVTLQYLDGTGTWNQFYFQSYAVSQGDHAEVGLPLAPVRMLTTNRDTSLHSFQACLTSLAI